MVVLRVVVWLYGTVTGVVPFFVGVRVGPYWPSSAVDLRRPAVCAASLVVMVSLLVAVVASFIVMVTLFVVTVASLVVMITSVTA